MHPERWRQIDTIFKSALEVPTGERQEFVARACGGDEELRREVESLIAYDRSGFLDEPPAEEAARVLAAASERARSLAGQTVGPYRILSRLGAGGMGEVHLAVHERNGRKVALKLLPPHLTPDEQHVRRFRQEARAVLRLNHPNIVTVYDIEQLGDASVIASEFIEGETLRARLARGPLATPMHSTSPRRPPPRSPPRTQRASFTATSSPRTSCSARTALSKSSTSASPS